MTSNINPSAINTQIPVANSNNASSDLRDNFAQIQNQLSIAAGEISTLQDVNVRLGGVVANRSKDTDQIDRFADELQGAISFLREHS